MKIDVPYEVADALVVASLKDQLEWFKRDLERNEAGENYLKNFDPDLKKDRKMLKKYIKTFERVLEYYGGAGNE